MKSKRKTYILLIVVLAIWGILIYKFFSFTSPQDNSVPSGPDITLTPFSAKPKDTFSIDVKYRDPFLGKMYNPNHPANTKKKVYIPKEPVVWPTIIYKGIVSDNRDKNKVFMLNINGQTFFMNEKSVEQEVTLLSGNRNSVTVFFKGEKNTITIQP